MKIYIAHNYSARLMLREVIPVLKSYGHEVTSRWIIDDTHDSSQLDAFNASVDLEDIDRADAILLFTDQFGDRPGKGKFVELGYAIGIGKKCMLHGKDMSCIFYHLAQIIHILDFKEISNHAV